MTKNNFSPLQKAVIALWVILVIATIIGMVQCTGTLFGAKTVEAHGGNSGVECEATKEANKREFDSPPSSLPQSYCQLNDLDTHSLEAKIRIVKDLAFKRESINCPDPYKAIGKEGNRTYYGKYQMSVDAIRWATASGWDFPPADDTLFVFLYNPPLQEIVMNCYLRQAAKELQINGIPLTIANLHRCHYEGVWWWKK